LDDSALLKLSHFPTLMQAVIFRNWEAVSAERIALVLETSTENVIRQAEKMSLPPQGDTSAWIEKGYITIIRNNWHILPYDQLLTLLGWDEDRLAFILKEDDFLNHKLGYTKPYCDKVLYTELTPEQEAMTENIKNIMMSNVRAFDSECTEEPFDFFSKKEAKPVLKPKAPQHNCEVTSDWALVYDKSNEDLSVFAKRFSNEINEFFGITFKETAENKIALTLDNISDKEEYHEIYIKENNIEIKAAYPVGILRGLIYLTDLAKGAGGMYFKTATYKREPQFEARYIYSYCGLYSDVFDVDTRVSFPDELLYEYSKVGVNGIWVQGILYTLAKFPFDPSLSKGYEQRRERLKDLIARAKKYGIKVYLYINEPRAMPLSFFDKHPEMKGTIRGDFAALCTTASPAVLEYLHDALKDLCTYVPDLGGFFTITMAENLTNCYSYNTDIGRCEHCKNRTPAEIVAEINNTIAKAVHSANPNIKVIATTWAWKDHIMSKNGEDCIRRLNDDIVLMCVSENALKYEIGGYKSEIIDYSISLPGPSEMSRSMWNIAKDCGLKTGAKVQINNSWECSTVPYLPVYGLIIEHLQNLNREGVNDLMLSWTLGGYPSPNIKIASAGFFKDINSDTEIDYDSAFNSLYGDESDLVKKATDLFCDGFREFPFHVKTLYRGPQNGGSANLLYDEPSGFGATMTCYAFDDLDLWRYEYPEDVFENQFRLLCEKWEKGLDLIKDMKPCEFKDMAYAGYSLFKSSHNQIKFVMARNAGDKQTMLSCAKSELEMATMVYRIMLKNASLGYEAANHYYYSRNNLMEKIVNCDYIIRKLSE
ncbi:MAG: hypothetical protein IKB55_00765, partial [Clostridia bacterium]|nr:hypothetical protein [Clostridia bacterium]